MAAVGATASHELGHNMNMDHDDASESSLATSSHCQLDSSSLEIPECDFQLFVCIESRDLKWKCN